MTRGAVIAALLVLGAGIGIAWIDTRSHWDDTGATVVALALAAGLGGLVRLPPWLVTLLVAGPLVVAELRVTAAVLVAIPIAFVAAWAGSLLRRGLASSS